MHPSTIPPYDRLTGGVSAPLPGWTGRWFDGSVVLDPNSSSDSRDLLTSDDLDALTDLDDELTAAAQLESWDALTIAQLAPVHANEDLEPTVAERTLEANLPSLAKISRHFITRLGETTEILPVARVRRPARRAIERFTSRTEDWAGRTLDRPEPRRALAVLREADPDLYENRMVNELIHPIVSTALARRIRRLRRSVSDLADLDSARDEGTHLRRERLYRFWGEQAHSAGEASRQANQTMDYLLALAASIRALQGSELVRLLKGRRTGSAKLRLTNVIENDTHYRAAGRIWRLFSTPAAAAPSPAERLRTLRQQHELFNTYALALVVRALGDIGCKQPQDLAPRPGTSTAVHAPWGSTKLDVTPDGTIVISSGSRTTRLVPLLDLLHHSDAPATATSRWTSVATAVTEPTAVIYLASSHTPSALLDPPLAWQLSSAGPDTEQGASHVYGIPVSPLETTSLERVARAVARAVLEPHLMDYPLPIAPDTSSPVPARVRDSLLAAGICEASASPLFHTSPEGDLLLRRPITAKEQSRLQAWAHERAVAARRPSWERDHEAAIAQATEGIVRSSQNVTQLLTCPVCTTEASPIDLGRSEDIMVVNCDCGASWGHNRCGHCGGRIPFLSPTSRAPKTGNRDAGWVERTMGHDALASPCWADELLQTFVCPDCGTCSRQVMGCRRCDVLLLPNRDPDNAGDPGTPT